MLKHPDAINLPDLQIWNNAAFDNGTTDDQTAIKPSLCPLKPILLNGSETLKLNSSKENNTTSLCKSPVRTKSPLPIKPLHPNGATEVSQLKPIKLIFKQGLLVPSTTSKTEAEPINDDRKIDTEIEEIEAEISRLSSKLESLRLEKAEGKQKSKNPVVPKKFEKTPSSSTSAKIRQRGVSLGPSEIIAGIRSQYAGKHEKTPIQSAQNRRKSCFWKLPEIDEEKVPKQRGVRSSSLSPKSRQSVSKIQSSRQGFTTIGSKKTERKSDGILSSIQPKKLFKEEEKSVSAKKPIKNGRVVASRYNQIPVQPAGNLKQSELRKMSLPGMNRDNNSKGYSYKKRASLAGQFYEMGSGRNQITENQTKMPLEIRNEALCDKNLEDFPPPSILKIDDLLPRIRTIKSKNESPRDSGPPKRVADLIGRKSYFGAEEIDVSTSVCQALSFDDEEDHE
ncbi:hypothetical protein BVC80_1433g55 [Macleaya cordata]|uniref:Uncharacterized protein n=1 Tax=Macleaya cordata TaxID=56857 RepID=A0A200QC15_MACCD|nr:hypothetical protein BVC80_1433g55 [Macleaya cordata]